MDYQEHIVTDPTIRSAKPRVRGTRMTVGDILSYLAAGMTQNEILADFPLLERADIRACLVFAAARERRMTGGLANQPDHARRRSVTSGTQSSFDRTTFEAGKMGGRACIRGLRITVYTVLSLVAGADD